MFKWLYDLFKTVARSEQRKPPMRAEFEDHIRRRPSRYEEDERRDERRRINEIDDGFIPGGALGSIQGAGPGPSHHPAAADIPDHHHGHGQSHGGFGGDSHFHTGGGFGGGGFSSGPDVGGGGGDMGGGGGGDAGGGGGD